MSECLVPSEHRLEPLDEIDGYPGPGAFLSSRDKVEYALYGVTVLAFNYSHAEYLACRKVVEEAGEEFLRCAVCHQPVRFMVLCRDVDTGRHYVLGRDCASTLRCGPRELAWDEKRKRRDVKKVVTKKGERFVHSRPVPEWYWQLPREERLPFVSLSKYEGPPRRGERRARAVWTVSVWGESVDEVLCNLDAFEARGRAANAAR